MLSKVNRLKGKANFDRIFKKGEKKYSPYFVIYRYLNPSNIKANLAPQIGIVTSKKVGGAVERNLARRKISVAVMAIIEQLKPAYQYVIIAIKGVQEAKVLTIKDTLSKLII